MRFKTIYKNVKSEREGLGIVAASFFSFKKQLNKKKI